MDKAFRLLELDPRSPDLTSDEFYLWGILKHRVFRTPVEPKIELKNRMRTIFSELKAIEIQFEMLVNGQHFE